MFPFEEMWRRSVRVSAVVPLVEMRGSTAYAAARAVAQLHDVAVDAPLIVSVELATIALFAAVPFVVWLVAICACEPPAVGLSVVSRLESASKSICPPLLVRERLVTPLEAVD